MNSIAVYTGSSPGNNKAHTQAAIDLARLMVSHKIDLVYGGATVGLMGVLADDVLSSGGKVTGIIPKSLEDRELSHQGITELLVVDSMHTRKAKMIEKSDGFIALPGGFGTLDEFFEVLTWSQLGLHTKPCGLLNIDGYYDLLIEFMDHQMKSGFVSLEHRNTVLVANSPQMMLDIMMSYQSTYSGKWVV
ncbi:MAG: hypothetical protein ACI959_000305 [Limisphaerales bacterium]|jgi:uncharacterized protein (TIGR00730 family)